jgi:hypothetical protein
MATCVRLVALLFSVELIAQVLDFTWLSPLESLGATLAALLERLLLLRRYNFLLFFISCGTLEF